MPETLWCPICGNPGNPAFGGCCSEECRRAPDDYFFGQVLKADQDYDRHSLYVNDFDSRQKGSRSGAEQRVGSTRGEPKGPKRLPDNLRLA